MVGSRSFASRPIALLLCLLFHVTSAVIPNAIVSLPSQDLLVRMATSFGSSDKATGKLAEPPVDNRLMCLPSSIDSYEGKVLLVPRGNCTFELKALHAQQAGASGIIVYNTLESLYRWNETSTRIPYPRDRWEYDCNNGRKTTVELELDPPQYNASFDPLLTQDSPSNICDVSNCDSRRCLVTGPSPYDNSTVEACCAWDLLVTVGPDRDLKETVEDIFVVFCTMEQGSILLQQGDAQVFLQKRSAPAFNSSSVLLWLLATWVTGFASWYSAKGYRLAYNKITIYMSDVAVNARSAITEDEETVATAHDDLHLQEEEEESVNEQDTEEHAQEEEAAAAAAAAAESEVENGDHAASNSSEEQQISSQEATPPPSSTRASYSNENVLELTVWHAVAFVVVASTILLLLFYFAFYRAVTILYAIGCSGAVGQLIFRPLYNLASRKMPCCCKWLQYPVCQKGCLKDTKWLDVTSIASGYILGGIWLAVGFTSIDPMSNPFFWITQDVMGACLCILFLAVIRLSSIKVATALLVVAFVYDIFFVFITPYIFDGESVMVEVATSGGAPDVSDENLCEKYPNDSECEGGDVLPMVLALPKINDYRGGATLLGLGDIVLPGLLTAFAARLDEAKRLAVLVGMRVHKAPNKWYHGYLLPLIAAYAVGLMFAYLAVRLMERGQPALLYIVPACLGTMLVVGWKELGQLWKGPQEITWADNLVRFCERGFRSAATTSNASATTETMPADATTTTTTADGAGSESRTIDMPPTQTESNASMRSLT